MDEPIKSTSGDPWVVCFSSTAAAVASAKLCRGGVITSPASLFDWCLARIVVSVQRIHRFVVILSTFVETMDDTLLL